MVLVIPGSLNLTGLHCHKAVERSFATPTMMMASKKVDKINQMGSADKRRLRRNFDIRGVVALYKHRRTRSMPSIVLTRYNEVDRSFYESINYSRSVGDTLAKIQHKNRESRAEKECKLVFHTVHTYS